MQPLIRVDHSWAGLDNDGILIGILAFRRLRERLGSDFMNRVPKVRLATSSDAPALVNLNDEFNGGRMPVAIVERRLQHGDEIVVICLLNDEPVGFACAQTYTSFCYEELLGEITEMYVQELARGIGLAGMMIECIEEQMRRQGVSTIKVLTGCDNDTAIRAYEKSGFVKEDEVMLEKQLNVGPDQA